jgi:hypothetical protein
MPKTPEELRSDAAELRERAEGLTDDNPAADAYFEHRADWCDYLARQREAE